MPLIDVSGHACYYQVEDFGKPETLMFSNSLGADLHMWDGVVNALKNSFNILRYDVRGHGKSLPSHTGYDSTSVADFGADVIALIKHLSVEKIHFCGLSLGGLIGQWLGIYADEKLERLILANTAARVGNNATWNERISQVKEHGISSITEATKARWFTENFRAQHADVVEAIMQTVSITNIDAYVAGCTAVRDADFTHDLHKISTPTLIISGDEDVVTTAVDAAYLVQHISQTKHVTLQAAHLSAVERSKEFAEALMLD